MSAKSPYRDLVECPKCEGLESRIAKLERENTRLNAALEKFENIKPALVHPYVKFSDVNCAFCGNFLYVYTKDCLYHLKEPAERISCALWECTKEHVEHTHIKCNVCKSWFIMAEIARDECRKRVRTHK